LFDIQKDCPGPGQYEKIEEVNEPIKKKTIKGKNCKGYDKNLHQERAK